MKVASIFAAFVVAGLLFLLWPREDAPPAKQADHAAHLAPADVVTPVVVRSLVEVPDAVPADSPAVEGESAATPTPAVVHEPEPAWINEATFIEAGLTREQASDLVEGLREVQQSKPLWKAQAEQAGGGSALCCLVLLELGPRLAGHIKDGAIPLRWMPRLKPWPLFAGNFFGWDSTSAAEHVLHYTAHGRVGFVSLEIPARVCDQDLWARMVVAHAEK